MELRIRNVEDRLHQALSVAATRQKKSLNQFIIEALRGVALRSAQKDKAVAAVLEDK